MEEWIKKSDVLDLLLNLPSDMLVEYIYEMKGVWFDEDYNGEWISVKEDRKPRHLQECFVAYVFGEDDSERHWYGVERWNAFEGNGLVDRPHFSNEGVEDMRVTHWMKISKLPK